MLGTFHILVERASELRCDPGVFENNDIAGVTRRGVLRGSMVLAGAGIAAAAAGRASAATPATGFVHGVASGDPLPTA